MIVNLKYICDYRNEYGEWNIGEYNFIEYPRWMTGYLSRRDSLWVWESKDQYDRWEESL